MSMIKTLIVDDDYLARAYLTAVADWEEEGFSLVAEAQDGEEALEKIAEFSPDLVITDISMPVMDGIELIKAIRSRKIPCRIVVLSCHDAYPHVKEALRQGADDYILKNEFKNEYIHRILTDQKIKLEETRSEAKRQEELVELAGIGRNELRKKFLHELADQEYSFEELQERSRNCGMNLSLQKTVVVGLRRKKNRANASPLPSDEPANSAYPVATVHLDEEEDFHATLEQLAVAISDHGCCCEAMIRSEVEGFLFLEGEQLTVSDLQQIGGILQKKIEEENSRDGMIVGISDLCIGMGSIKQAYLQAIRVLDTPLFRKSAVSYYDKDRPQITNALVGQAVALIGENYHEGVSLVGVAEKLNVNSTYLSRIFKQETGITFTDYLSSCRIARAKELLTHTDKKIKVIALDCGFYDEHYFCKIFKRMEGRSPLSYRRWIEGGEKAKKYTDVIKIHQNEER